jgi:hypothetical protein
MASATLSVCDSYYAGADLDQEPQSTLELCYTSATTLPRRRSNGPWSRRVLRPNLPKVKPTGKTISAILGELPMIAILVCAYLTADRTDRVDYYLPTFLIASSM